jgi:hypothetical protein
MRGENSSTIETANEMKEKTKEREEKLFVGATPELRRRHALS